MDSPAPKIPLTQLRHLYGMFDLFSSLESHRAMAQEVLRDKNPGVLADMFRRSVERFRAYTNIGEPFYPERPPRRELPDPTRIDGIGGTLALTSLLKAAGAAEVVDHPELSFGFVDREIVPARTTGNAAFEDDERSTRVRRLDWLLAGTRDRLPIIAEVKVGGDKDPFYALIQLLMYAAELATPAQRARLERHYPGRFAFPAAAGEADESGPVLDVYIVLSGYNPRSGVRQQILETTNQLCRRLVAEPGVARYVRRIACLDVGLGSGNQLRFGTVFSHTAASSSGG